MKKIVKIYFLKPMWLFLPSNLSHIAFIAWNIVDYPRVDWFKLKFSSTIHGVSWKLNDISTQVIGTYCLSEWSIDSVSVLSFRGCEFKAWLGSFSSYSLPWCRSMWEPYLIPTFPTKWALIPWNSIGIFNEKSNHWTWKYLIWVLI